MEDECFPTVSINAVCGRLNSEIIIKEEPYSENESTHSSCPPSPHHNTFVNHNESSVDKYFADTDYVSSP